MIDTVQVVLLFVIGLVTALLVVLGIQVFFILREFRGSVRRVNRILDNAEEITEGFTQPANVISGLFTSGGATLGPIISILKMFATNMSQHNKTHKTSGDNFLLGLILGGLLTALFTTKRGREILHELSEKGLDALEDIEKNVEKKVAEAPQQLQEVYDEEIDDTVAPVPLPTASEINHQLDQAEYNVDPKHPETQHKVRRFFKGVKKK
jgi:hypothetical protein